MQYLGTILFKILQPKGLKEEISESHMIVHYSRTWNCWSAFICMQRYSYLYPIVSHGVKEVKGRQAFILAKTKQYIFKIFI